MFQIFYIIIYLNEFSYIKNKNAEINRKKKITRAQTFICPWAFKLRGSKIHTSHMFGP